MALEHLRRMDNAGLPFADLENPRIKNEYDQKKFEEESSFLNTLNLNTKSTADRVRRVAISLRRKFEEGGINVDTVKALKWALEKTSDCKDANEFLSFLLEKGSFGSIEADRLDFR